VVVVVCVGVCDHACARAEWRTVALSWRHIEIWYGDVHVLRVITHARTRAVDVELDDDIVVRNYTGYVGGERTHASHLRVAVTFSM
jgi:hypothetical protein